MKKLVLLLCSFVILSYSTSTFAWVIVDEWNTNYSQIFEEQYSYSKYESWFINFYDNILKSYKEEEKLKILADEYKTIDSIYENFMSANEYATRWDKNTIEKFFKFWWPLKAQKNVIENLINEEYLKWKEYIEWTLKNETLNKIERYDFDKENKNIKNYIDKNGKKIEILFSKLSKTKLEQLNKLLLINIEKLEDKHNLKFRNNIIKLKSYLKILNDKYLNKDNFVDPSL